MRRHIRCVRHHKTHGRLHADLTRISALVARATRERNRLLWTQQYEVYRELRTQRDHLAAEPGHVRQSAGNSRHSLGSPLGLSLSNVRA